MSGAAGAHGAAHVQQGIVLCHFRTCRTNGATSIYSLQFKHGTKSWVVERRYSDFLRCHMQLLETFRREDLPEFPPKEPVFQKIFGRGGARSEWAEERKVLLHQYLTGLLEHRAASKADPLLDFINAPSSPSIIGGFDTIPQANTVLISGVRVRLTGEPGGIEVVVRADSVEACRVRLALRRLRGEGSLSREDHWRTLPEGLGITMEEVWERWLEFELPGDEAGMGNEASHRFSLEPGSLWQVGAVGVNADGITGNAVCIQLRAPTEVEMADLPTGRSGAAGAEDPDDDGRRPGQEATEVWAEALPSPRARPRSAGNQADAEEVEAEEWPVTRSFVAGSDDEAESNAGTSVAEVEGADESDSDSEECRQDAGENGAEAASKGEANTVGKVKVRSEANATEKAKTRTGGTGVVEKAAPRRMKLCIPKQRLLNGPEVHKVISYQGQAAAEYARKIEEKQRIWIERFPHRFEADRDGKVRSVPVKFSMVGRARSDSEHEGASSAEITRQSVEVLDSSRQMQQQLQLRKDEQAVASWIYAVTGDAGAQAAAEGRCSLQTALQSGEALCDLVNAVWPNRILGILRGDLKPYKKLANITRFIQACTDLGVNSIFIPADLSEGKNLRSVVRCLFALGARVPDPPEFRGPRLEDSIELPTPPKDEKRPAPTDGARATS